MRRRLIPALLLAGYSVVLVDLIVFKNIPVIHVGHMMFRLGGSYRTGEAQLVPFKTIASYVRGDGGRFMAIVNVAGNILPFIPLGLLIPLVYRRMTRLKAIVLAIGIGLAMELTEVIFRVGIFDVDDMILNGFGVVIGYGLFTLVARTRTFM